MKIKKNLIKILLFITLICLITYSNVYATGLDNVLGSADDFISTGQQGTVPINGGALSETSSIIYNTLLGIGMLIAIVVGIFIGIKFMVSTIDEKAKIKETLVAYVLGCIVVFGAFGIWKIVTLILGNI